MRLPSNRERFDKLLRRLAKEHDRLVRARADAPVIPLERAVRRGWEKTFELRGDVSHRPDRRVFSEVLAVVNRRLHSRDGRFLDLRGRPMTLQPQIIPAGQWFRLGWPASHQRLFAFGYWRDEEPYPFRWRRHWVLGFGLIRTWWLQEVIRPFMMTHRRVELPEVRRRLAEIDRFMTAHAGWDRLARLRGRSSWWLDLTWSRAELRQRSCERLEMASADT